jgi:hypothetical protein
MNGYIEDEFEYQGHTIQIVLDEEPENPRDDEGNIGHIVSFHSRYRFSDAGAWDRISKQANYQSYRTAEALKKLNAVYLPVYLFDHSILRLSTEPFTGPYADWDSGQVGFIYALPKDLRDAFSVGRATKGLREEARKQLKEEIELYDAYISGNVYRALITAPSGESGESGPYYTTGDLRAIIQREIDGGWAELS